MYYHQKGIPVLTINSQRRYNTIDAISHDKGEVVDAAKQWCMHHFNGQEPSKDSTDPAAIIFKRGKKDDLADALVQTWPFLYQSGVKALLHDETWDEPKKKERRMKSLHTAMPKWVEKRVHKPAVLAAREKYNPLLEDKYQRLLNRYDEMGERLLNLQKNLLPVRQNRNPSAASSSKRKTYTLSPHPGEVLWNTQDRNVEAEDLLTDMQSVAGLQFQSRNDIKQWWNKHLSIRPPRLDHGH
jgi:hypothetical protein